MAWYPYLYAAKMKASLAAVVKTMAIALVTTVAEVITKLGGDSDYTRCINAFVMTMGLASATLTTTKIVLKDGMR